MNDDDDFKIEELLEKPLLSSQEVKCMFDILFDWYHCTTVLLFAFKYL